MMMLVKGPAQIFAKVLQQDRRLTKAQARLGRDIKRLHINFSAQLEAYLRNPGNFSSTEAWSLAAAAQAHDQLPNLLKQAGLDDLADTFHEQFGPLTTSALEYFELMGVKPTLAGVDGNALDAFIHHSEITLRNNLDRSILDPIRTGLFQSTFGAVDRSSVVDQVMQTNSNISTARAEVDVDWAFESYQRQVTVSKAESLGLTIYQYLGPDDAITSDQCEYMLHINDHGAEGMLPVEEITTSLHPDLKYPPLQNGGHPRCRHKWMPVTESYALTQGYEA